MSDDDTVINFREAAERMATARKPNPELEERKKKAAEATAQRLDDADRVAKRCGRSCRSRIAGSS